MCSSPNPKKSNDDRFQSVIRELFLLSRRCIRSYFSKDSRVIFNPAQHDRIILLHPCIPLHFLFRAHPISSIYNNAVTTTESQRIVTPRMMMDCPFESRCVPKWPVPSLRDWDCKIRSIRTTLPMLWTPCDLDWPHQYSNQRRIPDKVPDVPPTISVRRKKKKVGSKIPVLWVSYKFSRNYERPNSFQQ